MGWFKPPVTCFQGSIPIQVDQVVGKSPWRYDPDHIQLTVDPVFLDSIPAALDDAEFVSRTLEVVRGGLAYLYQNLKDMGLEYLPTQTNFFLIKVPRKGKEIYERMLKQGVIVRAMDSYGLANYIRINVGLPEENERFIRTLKAVL